MEPVAAFKTSSSARFGVDPESVSPLTRRRHPKDTAPTSLRRQRSTQAQPQRGSDEHCGHMAKLARLQRVDVGAAAAAGRRDNLSLQRHGWAGVDGYAAWPGRRMHGHSVAGSTKNIIQQSTGGINLVSLLCRRCSSVAGLACGWVDQFIQQSTVGISFVCLSCSKLLTPLPTCPTICSLDFFCPLVWQPFTGRQRPLAPRASARLGSRARA